jgi:hypothetical protein
MLAARMRDPDGSILTVFSMTSDQPVPDRSDTHRELHALVKRRIAAVRAEDPAPLFAQQHPDVVAFNVLPPLVLSGRHAVDE